MLIRILTGRLALILFSASLLTLYAGFIQPGNAYLGYSPIQFTPEYFLAVSLAFFTVVLVLPLETFKPSDFFQFFYGFLVILPYGLLYCSEGEVEFGQFLINFSVIALPSVFVGLLSRVTVVINAPGLFRVSTISIFLALCMLFGTLYVLIMAPKTASFDLASIYVRRLDARDVFAAGSLGAYVQSITVNGLLPLSAYMAGLTKNNSRLLAVVFCGVVFFYVLGLRAQFSMILIGYMLGRNAAVNTVHRLPRQILLIVLLVMIVALAEWVWFDFSLVGDQVVRRVFTVPPFIVAAYFDLIGDTAQGWSVISGLTVPNGVTYLVGELYFNSAESNANTNSFLFQLTTGGGGAYLFNVVLVGFIFVFLDSLYKRKRHSVFLYLGFIFSVLLVEQNATTALLSSGIGLFLIAFSLMKTLEPNTALSISNEKKRVAM